MPLKTVSVTPVAAYQAPNYVVASRQVTIYNLSSKNPVYYSDSPGTVDAQSDYIPQGGAETFDGQTDVWLSTLDTSVTVQIQLKIGSVSFASGSVAGSGGYILPGNESVIYQAGAVSGPIAFTLPAQGSFTPVELYDVSAFQSYDISMAITNGAQNAVGSALACKFRFQWFNDAISGLPVYTEDWYPWVLSTINGIDNAVVATGPMHGRYMTIEIFNPGINIANVRWLAVYGSPRMERFPDWRQGVNSVQTVTPNGMHSGSSNGGTGFDGCIADYEATLSASANYFMPFNLYAGPVDYYFHVDAALAYDAVFLDIGANYEAFTSGNVPVSGPSAGSLFILANTTNGQYGSLLLPQGACALILPTGPTAPHLQFKVTARNQ